MATQAKN